MENRSYEHEKNGNPAIDPDFFIRHSAAGFPFRYHI
jgi:hypothetical protein